MLLEAAYQNGNFYSMEYAYGFLWSTGWNVRDIRQSVGDGAEVTIFAMTRTGWTSFLDRFGLAANREEFLRLIDRSWRPHLLDLVSNSMVQGLWSHERLMQRFQQEGPYNLTTLANEMIEVDYSTERQMLVVGGGNLIVKDMQGVDGMVHFTSNVTLPKSATRSIYEIAEENPNFSTHISYLDATFLSSDIQSLSPMTALFAPNAAWEGTMVPLEELADTTLKSFLFGELLWCEDLQAMGFEGQSVVSLNQQTWKLSINELGFPCFAPLDGNRQACITNCDVLAKNGIIHELDLPLESSTDQDMDKKNKTKQTTDIFDLDFALGSSVPVNAITPIVTKYYCIFRSNWNGVNHPALYPELARWANPVLFSHTKQFTPFLMNSEASYGVKKIAEESSKQKAIFSSFDQIRL